MLKIKILGTGCARCQALEKNTKEAITDLSVDAEIDHVKDINKIMEYPILTTPGLVIDDKLVVSGRVPTKAEVTTFITTALANQEESK